MLGPVKCSADAVLEAWWWWELGGGGQLRECPSQVDKSWETKDGEKIVLPAVPGGERGTKDGQHGVQQDPSCRGG